MKTNGICATRRLSQRMTRESSEILTYKRSPDLSKTTRPHNNNKKETTFRIVDFAVLAHQRLKLREREKNNQYLDIARELKKLRNMILTLLLIVIGAFGIVTNGLVQGLNNFEIKRRGGDHSNYRIVDTGYNTAKSPGEFRSLLILQTPMKEYQLMLMWKIL